MYLTVCTIDKNL